VQAGGNRQQGLAGAGLAHQGNQLDTVIHQHIQGKGLLTVAGEQAPDALLGNLAHRNNPPILR